MTARSEPLLSVAEAQAVVREHARPLPPTVAALSWTLAGAVLAEDVVSDLDMPPYDKALMDGYAVRRADLAAGPRPLEVIEEITAGRTPQRSVGVGQAARIMTGAPLPDGADAVVQVERTRQVEGGRVLIEEAACKPEQNIMRRGREMRRGEVVLRRGSVLRPQEFGVLAAVGRTTAAIHRIPHVAVLSTGDEVVEAAAMPGAGQIRNGNGPMLLAQTARALCEPEYLGIARDRLDSLRPLVERGLESDVLLLSGGVSAGKLDLVPGVLRDLGVTAHFHKVAMKPGKPVLFGSRGATLVFGLPGNPVSALVCFELFARPALRRLRGLRDGEPTLVQAELAEEFVYRTDRPTYYPALLEAHGAGWRVRPVAWFGSPDLRGLTAANAFVVVAPGEHHFAAGHRLPVLCVEQPG